MSVGIGSLATLMAGIAIESVLAPLPARAEMLSLDQPVQAASSFAELAKRVKPAVVSVRVKGQRAARDFFQRFREKDGNGEERGQAAGPSRRGPAEGSGFFISADGYVVTSNNVVANAGAVEVIMHDGRTLEAKVTGTDPKTDIALLKVSGRDFPYVRLAHSKSNVGDWILAIGNPFGLGGTVTAGIVSAEGRNLGVGPYDDFIQINASVNPGDSGSPVLNLAGEAIGVTTAMISPPAGSVIAFAVPSHVVQEVVADLMASGKVTRGSIGAKITALTQETAAAAGLKEATGALVVGTIDDSPAAKAGLRTGDAITAVDGEPIKDARALALKIASYPPGKTVPITVWRDGTERTVSIEIGG